MANNSAKPAWSVPVSLSEIPEGGKHFDLIADETTRAAVAALAGLRSLPRLQASFDVTRYGQGGLKVDGEVSATVGQNCVVTLDPLDNEVREEINLVFAPPRQRGGKHDDGDEIDILDLNEPEPMDREGVDLGVLATEFLMVGIDPYPRKPDATFAAPAADDESERPFAVLAALKRPPEGKK